MASMVPYDHYNRMLRRAWPFDTMEELFQSPFSSLASAPDGFKMNVEDTDGAYVVTAELPGVKRDQIDVELNEGRLSISVQKQESEEEKAKNYLHKETTEWSATRGIYLKDAAVEGLTAKLADGMLTVNVPKQEPKSNVTKVSVE